MKKLNSTGLFRSARFGLLVAAFGLLTLGAAAQNGTWYFGTGAGMSFPSGPNPLAGSVMNQSEGTATVVDVSNNVVMYSDGMEIWNGNHVNQGYKLGGDFSSTQSVLIVPIPGTKCRQYYIFTAPASETGYSGPNGVGVNGQGFRVSLATVSGVAPATTISINPTDENINLLTGSYANNLCGEKLAATPDGQGGYWVITHGVGTYSNSGALPRTLSGPINVGGESDFYAVHVTPATSNIPALTASLVVSTIPTFPVQHGVWYFNGQGQMKFDKAGNRIAMALTGNREWQLYDFNPATGVVSNQLHMANFGVPDPTVYGIEFSPNSQYVYVATSFGGSPSATTSAVHQFDITSGTPAGIIATGVQVSPIQNNPSYYYAGLQLGPDDKIYAARSGQSAIDVIPNPDLAACGFISAGAAVAGTCKLTLPSMVLRNECEYTSTNPPESCNCRAQTGVPDMNPIAPDGTGFITLALNSGVPVRKIKVTIVNFNMLSVPSCQACNPNAVNAYGTFTSTPVVAGSPGVLSPAVPMGLASFSREIIWTFPTATLVNSINNINIQFPPVLAGCGNGAEFCLRIDYIDDNCSVCENTVFVTMNPDGTGGSTSGKKAKESIEDRTYLRVYPNPAATSITVNMPNDISTGTVKIYNSEGRVVLEQKVSSSVQVINTQALADGMYIVRFEDGAKQYSSTLVISK